MRKKIFMILLISLLVLFTSSNTVMAQKPIELSFNMFLPPGYGLTLESMSWAKEVEKRTGGKVKITIYPGQILTKADRVYDGVVGGISDMGFSVLSYTRGRFPFMEACDLPIGITSGEMAALVVSDFYKKFLPKEFADSKILSLFGPPPAFIHTTKKPVRRLEDLRDLKIRSTGLSAKLIKALGGIPVAMVMGEAYEALQRGIVDGAITTTDTLKGYKHAEVIKYSTDSSSIGYTSTCFTNMNLKVWNSLPADVQKTIEVTSQEWAVVYGKKWDDLCREGLEFSSSRGNALISLTKEEEARWKEAVKPLLADYISAMEAQGLPGKEALDELIRLVKKYSK